jgi:hypothetical protein
MIKICTNIELHKENFQMLSQRCVLCIEHVKYNFEPLVVNRESNEETKVYFNVHFNNRLTYFWTTT